MSRPGVPAIQKVWEQLAVDSGDSCYEWQGTVTFGGYGTVYCPDHGRPLRVHRLVYEAMVGPIPEGLEIDHLCRNRSCANPNHLEAVTQRENALRGIGVGALNARRTHCQNGHPFDDANTYVAPGRGSRRCRICQSAAHRAARARRAAA